MTRITDFLLTTLVHIAMPFVVLGLLVMVAIEKVRK